MFQCVQNVKKKLKTCCIYSIKLIEINNCSNLIFFINSSKNHFSKTYVVFFLKFANLLNLLQKITLLNNFRMLKISTCKIKNQIRIYKTLIK